MALNIIRARADGTVMFDGSVELHRDIVLAKHILWLWDRDTDSKHGCTTEVKAPSDKIVGGSSMYDTTEADMQK